MVKIRPFRTGDDLRLAELLHDPTTPAEHFARSLLRAPSSGATGEGPALCCVVATLDDDDVVVGAAAIAAAPLHPARAWVHVEVAAEERGHGIGSALLAAVREQTVGTDLEGLPLRARIAADAPGAAIAAHWGFGDLSTTRVIRVQPMALGNLGADRVEDFQVTATGSVALTQAFGAWYAGVNRVDPVAPLSPGRINAAFLSEAAGAYGAALLRRAGRISAFAVSYAIPEAAGRPEQAAPGSADAGPDGVPEEATELTVGVAFDAEEAAVAATSSDTDYQAALQDAGVIIARLSTDVPVDVEVTSEMPVLGELLDGLLTAHLARVLYTYTTLGD